MGKSPSRIPSLPICLSTDLNLFPSRDHVGESMIHLWIEKVREYLQSRSDSDQAASEAAANQERESLEKNSLEDVLELEGDCPLVSSAEPFTDRKSTFQGHAAAVTSVKQVK